MKRKILFLALLLSVLISFAQKSENSFENRSNCFTNTEIDSLYSKIIEYKYLKKEVPILNQSIIGINKILEENKNQIDLLNEQKITLKAIISEKDKVIQNDKEIMANYEFLVKSEKKKKIPVFLKGAGVGAVTVFIIKFFVVK